MKYFLQPFMLIFITKEAAEIIGIFDFLTRATGIPKYATEP